MSIAIMYGYRVSLKTPETLVCYTIESDNIIYGTDGTDINMRRNLPEDSLNRISEQQFEAEVRKIETKCLFPVDSPFFVLPLGDSEITFYRASMFEIIVGLPILRSTENDCFVLDEKNNKDVFYNHWRYFQVLMPRTSKALSDECGEPRFYYVETHQ